MKQKENTETVTSLTEASCRFILRTKCALRFVSIDSFTKKKKKQYIFFIKTNL